MVHSESDSVDKVIFVVFLSILEGTHFNKHFPDVGKLLARIDRQNVFVIEAKGRQRREPIFKWDKNANRSGK